MVVLFDIILRLVLAPVLVTQGILTRKTAASLPEAAGKKSGQIGDGPVVRVLLLGDSSMAGVGVETLDQALPGGIARHFNCAAQLDWTLSARIGATSQQALDLIPRGERFDIAVLGLGTNDVTHLVPRFLWLRQQSALFEALRTTCGVRQIIVTGLPPIRHFPLLPQPLRYVLGRESERFDAALVTLAQAQSDVDYVTLHLPDISSQMAPDGFHPGAGIFMEWGRAVAEAISAGLARRG